MRFERGSILIVVLFAMSLMSLAALSYAYRVRLEGRLVRHRAVEAALEAQANSAAAVAMARLAADTNDFDHPAEPWSAHPPLAGEGWLTERPGEESAFVTHYRVIDEEGKLHATRASSDALERLGMTAEQIASVFDWMDEDGTARSEGAEDDYYLARRDPYRAKNAPLSALDELLMIRGFSAADYWGRAQRWDQPGPWQEATLASDGAGWVDLLTCVGDGHVNINTAPRAVLETLPISTRAVEQVVGFRSFDGDSAKALRDHAFKSLDDIQQLQGLSETDRTALAAVAAFRSAHFRILVESRHQPTGLYYRLDILVRRRVGEGVQVLQWNIVR